MVKGDYKAGKRPWFIVPNVYTTGGSWYWCAVCNKNLGAGHEDTERHGRKQQWAEWAFVHDPLKFQEEFSWVFGASPQATTPAPLADATFNPLAQLSLRQALALLDEGQADTPEAALRRGPAQMALEDAPRHGPAQPNTPETLRHGPAQPDTPEAALGRGPAQPNTPEAALRRGPAQPNTPEAAPRRVPVPAQPNTPEAALRRGPAQMAFAAAPRPVRHGPALPKPSQQPEEERAKPSQKPEEEEEEKNEEEIPWELARCMTKCWRDAQQSAGNHEAELRDAGPGADGSVDQRRVRPRRQPGAAGRGAKTPKPHRRW